MCVRTKEIGMDNNQDTVQEAPTSRGPRLLTAFLNALTLRKLFLIALLCAAVVGLYVFLFVPRLYQAQTSLLLNEHPDVVASLSQAAASEAAATGSAGALGLMGGNLGGNSEVQRLEAILQSRSVRDEVLAKEQLRERLNLQGQAGTAWMAKITKVKAVGSGLIGGGVGLEISVTLPSSARVSEWLGKPYPFSTAEAQKYCAQLANDYVALLDLYLNKTNVQSAREDRLFVEQRKREEEAELSKIEDRLQALQAKYKVVDPGPEAQHLLDLSKDAANAYALASTNVDAAEASLRPARASLTHEQATRVTSEINLRNPVIAGLEDQLAQFRLDYANGLATGKSPQHPDMVALRASIANAESQETAVAREVRDSLTKAPNPIHDTIMGQVVTLEVSLAAARASKAKYGSLLAQLQAKLDSLPPVARTYAHLSAQRELQAQLVAASSKRLQIAMIQERSQSADRFQIMDAAVPPDAKSGPSAVKSAGVTFILIVLLLGLMMAYQRGLFVLEE